MLCSTVFGRLEQRISSPLSVLRVKKRVRLGSTVFADDGVLVYVEIAEAISNDA